MRKSWYYLVLGLLFAFCIILAGCGSKKSKSPTSPNNPPASTIRFILPDSYTDGTEYYGIPADKKVKFYILAAADEDKTVEPLATFTEKTGDSALKFTLPETLKGLACYIYAVIEIKDPYELAGNTISDAMGAAQNGEILFGAIIDDVGQAIPVTLNNNVTIGNFTFLGKGEGEPVKNIYFVIPDTYWAGDTQYDIPSNLEIKIFSVSGFDENGKMQTDHIFTGTTGQGEMRRTLPDYLVGKVRKFAAVIYLKESSFTLNGKTQEDVQAAILKGEILYGQTEGEHALSNGIHVDDFEFHGPIPNGVIKFEMPTKCVTGTPIPSGKTVKFYAIVDTTKLPLEADYVFKGTTGRNLIECELPGKYIGKEYFFFAVIILEGDFDLEGKYPKDLEEPLNNNQIMFGQAKEEGDGEERPNILYKLEDGLVVRGFEFID